MVWGTAIALVVSVWILWKYLNRKNYNGIPGPKGLPVIGATHLLSPITSLHKILKDLSEQYGPVMLVRSVNGDSVVLSDYESIYEVLMKQGLNTAIRSRPFRLRVTMGMTGLFSAIYPDSKWKHLRKATHQHLKQFGDGMTDLENVIQEVSEDMFDDFTKHCGKPYDPHAAIYDTAINIMAVLILGERPPPDKEFVNKLYKYEKDFMKFNGTYADVKYMIMDMLPWLRHFGYKPYQDMLDYVKFENEIWETIKSGDAQNPHRNSMSRVLMEHMKATDGYNETDASHTIGNLLIAGITTTSNSLWATINVLAHEQEVQDKIYREISSVVAGNAAVSLAHRQDLHYCRAVLLEVLRYTNVACLADNHCNAEPFEVHGYTIPKNTRLMKNFYALRMNEKFWKNPKQFQPERFLDEKGEVVLADHPNRKNILPFSTGPRVCVGESLAQARLFLWITTVVQRFKIDPAPGSERSSIDPDNYQYAVILTPPPYQIIFTQR